LKKTQQDKQQELTKRTNPASTSIYVQMDQLNPTHEKG
jgi:hypothetical protein